MVGTRQSNGRTNFFNGRKKTLECLSKFLVARYNAQNAQPGDAFSVAGSKRLTELELDFLDVKVLMYCIFLFHGYWNGFLNRNILHLGYTTEE